MAMYESALRGLEKQYSGRAGVGAPITKARQQQNALTGQRPEPQYSSNWQNNAANAETGGPSWTPDQLAEHWRQNPGSMQDAIDRNPEAWGFDNPPVDDGGGEAPGWQNTGTGDEGGSGWQENPWDDYEGDYFTGDINPGRGQMAWNEGYGWINTARDAVIDINQGVQEEIADTRTDLQGIAQQGYYDKTGAFREGMDLSEEALTDAQAGIEKGITQSNIGATIALKAGEESALGTLEDYTGQGVDALDPYAQTGMSAQQKAAALSGALGPEAEAAARAEESESPYQTYLREQAQREVMQNAAATGGTQGGNVLKALQDRSMALSGQFEQQRMDNLMGLGQQGLEASSQQAQLYGEAATNGALIGQQTGQQMAANNMAAGQSLSQSRANLATGLSDIAKMRGISEREMAQELEASLSAITSQTGAAQVAAMQSLAASMQGFGQSGVDFIANLNAAIRSASPGANSSAGYANAGATVLSSVLGNWDKL